MNTIWHISDTHGYHKLLKIPKCVDIVIHSGDFSNNHDVYLNEPEAKDFLAWYRALKIKHKILIAGNHDAYAFKQSKDFKKICEDSNITYLENDFTIIDDLKIYGTPITPSYGNWFFQKARFKTYQFFEKSIPDDIDILVSHGPPEGILDLTLTRSHELMSVGDSGLRTLIDKKFPNIMANLFGHIHNVKHIKNAGTRELSGRRTVFSNGSVVTDNKFGELSSNGSFLIF